MKYDDTTLEYLIQEALKEESESMNIPPSQQIWQKILLDRQTVKAMGKPIYQRFYTTGAIACLILIVSFVGLFMSNQSAIAINNRILKTVVDFFTPSQTTGVVSVSISSNPAPTSDMPPPPPDWPLDTGEKVVTLEQARLDASFDFMMPSFLPKGIRLDIITVLDGFRVNQYYRSDKNRLIIEQRHFTGGFASSHQFSSSKVKKVHINSAEATLVTQRNPYTGLDQIHILWCVDNINFGIQTDLSERDALKIARSLK